MACPADATAYTSRQIRARSRAHYAAMSGRVTMPSASYAGSQSALEVFHVVTPRAASPANEQHHTGDDEHRDQEIEQDENQFPTTGHRNMRSHAGILGLRLPPVPRTSVVRAFGWHFAARAH